MFGKKNLLAGVLASLLLVIPALADETVVLKGTNVNPGDTLTKVETGGGFAAGCAGELVTNTNTALVSITASARVIGGTTSKKVYICHIELVTAAANNVAIVEGTGSTCGTTTAGMAGGVTAATGFNFAANGGISAGNGQGVLMKEATALDDVCILVSAATQLSGVIVYAVK